MVEPVSRIGRKSEALSDSLARYLEQLILDGTLKPDGRIPSERQLAQRFGVSRNILREALRALRGRGLIETRHGRGSVVAGLVPRLDQASPLVHLFANHSRTLYDLLEVRETLEARAAFLAAERATDADLHRIGNAFNALEHLSVDDDSIDAARRDHAFHRSICEASHNPVLMHTLDSLMQLMMQSVLACVKNLYHRAPSKQQIDRHHREIYEAVIGRQPDRAYNAAAAHIRNVRERLQEIESVEQRLDRSVNWEKIVASAG